MSFRSSLEYYRLINEAVQERVGRLHSAVCLLYSVDFQPVADLQHEGRWEELGEMMLHAAKNLEGAGAEILLICANTVHKVAEEVQRGIKIPLLHIADVTGRAMKRRGISKAGLLGTRFTMEDTFYRDRLSQNHGVQALVPESRQRESLHRVIYEELCSGKKGRGSKKLADRIIRSLVRRGAQGIVLACTELPLLISQRDVPVRLFDTMRLHAEAAVEAALQVPPVQT
jgi:aspartate racemase